MSLQSQFDAWQVRRARRAYQRISDNRSTFDGFKGMVEEMRWGINNLCVVDRDEADRLVLEGAFMGPLVLKVLQSAHKLAPGRMHHVMAAASPLTLHWLVGAIEHDGTTNIIPKCQFREAGGPQLCEHVCRRPSEAFCASRAVPVSLEPDPDSLGCTWRWGSEPLP